MPSFWDRLLTGIGASPRQLAEPRPRADTSIKGVSGLRVYSGTVYEEWWPELQGDRWRRLLQEMTTQDPMIGAILFAITNLLRQVQWNVIPASEDQAALDTATFIEQALHDMETTWPDTVAEMTTFLSWGWSYHEQLFKHRDGYFPKDPTRNSDHDDGRIGWRGFPIRSQDTLADWDFGPSGEVLGLYQSAPPDFDRRYIPAGKAIHLRTTSRKGNPEGVSILRNSVRPYLFKKRIEQIEGIGVERDLAGLPVAWVPAQLMSETATAADQAILTEIKNIVTNIRRDEQEGVVMPMSYDESGNKMYDLTLLSTGGSRQFDTGAIIDRYDRRIAQSCLADVILLGHEKVGSFALADSKTTLLAVALGVYLDIIAAEFNGNAIPTLMRLNGVDRALWPTMGHGDIESQNLADLGAYIERLAKAGFPLFPNERLEKHLLDVAGLPMPPETGTQKQAAEPVQFSEREEARIARITDSLDREGERARELTEGLSRLEELMQRPRIREVKVTAERDADGHLVGSHRVEEERL